MRAGKKFRGKIANRLDFSQKKALHRVDPLFQDAVANGVGHGHVAVIGRGGDQGFADDIKQVFRQILLDILDMPARADLGAGAPFRIHLDIDVHLNKPLFCT